MKQRSAFRQATEPKQQMTWFDIGVRVLAIVLTCAFFGVLAKFAYMAFQFGWGLW